MTYFLDQIQNGLALGCVYALIALGFAMVFGVLRILNFAHSEVFTTGAFIGYFALRWLLRMLPASPGAAVLLCLAVSALGTGVTALLLERVAYRPIRREPKVSALLTAIGASVFLQSVGLHVFSAHTRGYPAADVLLAPRQMAALVLCASYAYLQHLVLRTPTGLRMRAVAENAAVAQLMGVDPNRAIRAAFFTGGAFAGVAGVVWGLVYQTINPQMGFYPSLKAFIIAVVGSVGSLRGTFVVGLGLGLTEALLAGYLPSALSGLRDVLTFGLLFAALLWKPSGLFDKAQPEKV